MLNVIVFTDYGKLTGFGHLTRCIALYEAFQEFNCNVKLIVNTNDSIPSILSGLNYDIKNWTSGINSFSHEWDITIADSYNVGADILESMTNNYPCAVFFDDIMRMEYPRGIVVNGAIFAEEMQYPVNPEVTYLLGAQYAPLRKIFWESKKKMIADKIRRVLITTGGNDSKKLIPQFIDLFRNNFPTLKLDILVSSNSEYLMDIRKRVNDHVNLIIDADTLMIHQIMTQSDLAITGAGQTLYELAVMGIPAIAIQVADNQEHNISGWMKAGFIEFAGKWNDSRLLDNILKCYHMLSGTQQRQVKSETGQQWVTGTGAKHLAAGIIKYYIEKNLILRKSSSCDMQTIFELSNDPEVRANSYHMDPILLTDHEKWFLHKIDDKKCLFLIAEIAGKLIGQVRFDVEGDAVISISIHKNFRHAGIGQLVMGKALRVLKNNFPAIGKVIAYVKDENNISKQYFEKCGFQFTSQVYIQNTSSAEYIYSF